MARRLLVRVSMFTRLPTGSSSVQSPDTPMGALSGPQASSYAHLFEA